MERVSVRCEPVIPSEARDLQNDMSDRLLGDDFVMARDLR
jgi:hypothetical protein